MSVCVCLVVELHSCVYVCVWCLVVELHSCVCVCVWCLVV